VRKEEEEEEKESLYLLSRWVGGGEGAETLRTKEG